MGCWRRGTLARTSRAMKCRPTAKRATKALPRMRAAARMRRRRASAKVRWARIRTPRARPGPRKGPVPTASSVGGGIPHHLQEQLLERGAAGREVIEADALRGEPPAHLGQARLALDPEADDFPILTHVASEPGQSLQDGRGTPLEAQLHLDVALGLRENRDSHDAPVLDEGYPVAGHLHLAQEVRVQEDGGPAGPEVADHVTDQPAPEGVETGSGLVEEDELRLAEQCLGQANALPHALAVVVDAAAPDVPELHPIEQLLDLPVERAPAKAQQAAVEAEQLAPLQPLVEGEVLGQVAHTRARAGVAQTGPQEPPIPRRGADEPEQHLHGRGLARAVGAQEAEDLTPRDGQGEVPDRDLGAELLPERARLEGGLRQCATEPTAPSRGPAPRRPARRERRPCRGRTTAARSAGGSVHSCRPDRAWTSGSR